jgi:predicted PurR-regulated permease PerM
MGKKITTADTGKHGQEAGSAPDNASQPTAASDNILIAGSSQFGSGSSIDQRTGKPTEAVIRLRQVRFELSPKTIMMFVLVAVSAWLLIRLWPVFLVLVAALVIAGTLSPAVTWLEARHVKRGLGIGIVFLSFFIFALLVVFLTIPTLAEQVMSILEHESLLRAQLADYFAGSDLTTPLATWLRGLKPDALRSALSDTAFAFSMRFFVAFAYGLSALFLGLYIMIDRDRLRGGLFALFPRAHH